MKKVNPGKIIILLTTLGVSAVSTAVTLKLDKNLVDGGVSLIPTIVLKGNTQYQIGTSQLSSRSTHPIICNRIEDYTPVANVNLRITDPNGDNKGDSLSDLSLMGVDSNVNYNIGRKSFDITTENRSKSICLTDGKYDVLFEDTWDEPIAPAPSAINYEIIGAPLGGFVPGESVRYDITYVNNTAADQELDLIEYFPYNKNSLAYFEGQSVSLLSCDVLDDQGADVGDCTSNNGVIKDILLSSNYSIRLSVRRPISVNAAVGENIQLMAAIFTKVNTIDSTGVVDRFTGNKSFSGFEMTTIDLPIVSPN